jgi:hypothetical protein
MSQILCFHNTLFQSHKLISLDFVTLLFVSFFSFCFRLVSIFSLCCCPFRLFSFRFVLLRCVSFLAHLSWKLKWAFLIVRCPSSVRPSASVSVRLSVKQLHFRLLLQHRWANFNQTWHKASSGKGDSELYKWRTTPFPKGS